ncbi:RICIN domain-containing protein [Plantactinospora sp. CA-294935]|uniref:RICIN domain-containing protein n=1 Tax=Plantactinospora sp. CA-294935 TaxID=3240012 RepID=UPI003D8D87BF
MQQVRRRCATVLAATLAAGVLLVPASAAEAAVPLPDPVAIGQATEDDLQVLAADADAAGTKVKVRSYQVGQLADVKAQRWSFEVVTPGAAPVYRIRHASSGRCLQAAAAADGADVALADCGTADQQLWTTGTARTFPTGGFALRNKRDGRCLDLYNSADNAPATMWGCSSYFATQLWRIRIGTFDCPARHVIALCVHSSDLVSGVMGAWRQHPMTLNEAGSTPRDANTMSNQVNWNPLTSGGDNPGYDYVEMGWRGDYLASTNSTSHSAYWVETGLRDGWLVEEYHAIDAVDSTLDDGTMHTWMSLGNSDGQWDMFYDFNPVGTTQLATGGRARDLQYGLLPQYAENTVLDKTFENRVQILGDEGLWRRPQLREVAAFPANVCGQPDPLTLTLDEPDSPPHCFTASLVTRDSSAAGLPGEVDRFVVGKPGVGSVARTGSVPPAPAAPASGVHNGVDQRALAACLAADATRCLATVPGLADCVRARKVCNTTRGPAAGADRRAAAPKRSAPVTADAARQRARAAVGDRAAAAGVHTTTLTAADFTRRSGTTLNTVDGAEKVHVVTSDSPATGLSRQADRSYAGYTMVYLAETGRLLYACLGHRCVRKEFA